MTHKAERHKGRGALTNPDCRYGEHTRESIDDGWRSDEAIVPVKTTVFNDNTRSIITHNQSPDVPFNQSINPYRGCEHGCIYCFARPTHAYLGLSPGLDFETRIQIKPDAAEILRAELQKPAYVCQPIALGTNTDPYQPLERYHGITRSVLTVMQQFRQPVAIVTKSSMIERDIDILSDLARDNLVQVMVSVNSLDRKLTRLLEPRATAPQRRLQTIERLVQAGIPTGVLVAPIIPVLNEAEIETVLQAAAQAGARSAGYVVLRLPQEVAPLFEEWLQQHYPLRANRILNHVRDMRGGKLYRATFGERMTGQGQYAELIRRRFDTATKKLGYHLREEALPALNCSAFSPPYRQIDLF